MNPQTGRCTCPDFNFTRAKCKHLFAIEVVVSRESKTRTAQINETLCKVLCHNICVLIQSMYELNLKPKFWKEVV